MKLCHRCGKEWISEKRQPAIKETCPACTSYLHCCLNCRHYAPYAHNKCRIPTTDWVGDRAGPAFCDDFEFADAEAAQSDNAKKSSAREALDKLFGDL